MTATVDTRPAIEVPRFPGLCHNRTYSEPVARSFEEWEPSPQAKCVECQPIQ